MKLFMSHIHEESALATVLKGWVESSFPGLTDVFVSSDIADMPAGIRWLEQIDGALQQCQAFIVLCSPTSLARPWIIFETGCAWIKRIPVIPICHSGTTKSTLPIPLSQFQALELNDGEFISHFLRSLAKHLGVDKVPRIDQKSMLSEIGSAIASFPASSHKESMPAEDDVAGDPVEDHVLKRIADLGDKGVPAKEMALHFEVAGPKMQYYLDNLVRRRLLRVSAVGFDMPALYSLTQEGRRYLVKKGLL